MNIKLKVAIQSIILLCLLMSSQVSMANTGNLDVDIKSRVENLNSSVDVRYTAEVRKRIQQYTVKQRGMSSKLLGRVNIYFPLFENVLRERQLPEDLKYLAVIESGLNPNAYSRAGAAGLWQFMKPTARMQGLKVSKYIDERRDPVRSTYAAADYLQYLYEKFDDWTMALAAYNCGPGNVRKAIRKSGGKRTYWEIQKYLPRETRQYVPKFIAMSYMMNYYYEHDLSPTMPQQELVNTMRAKVYNYVSLRKLGQELGVAYSTMKWLNGKYVKGIIPSDKNGAHTIILPQDAMFAMMDKYNVEPYHLPIESPVAIKKIVKEEVVEHPSQPAKVMVKRDKVHLTALPKTWHVFDEEKHLVNTVEPQTFASVGTYKYRTIGRKESLKQIAQEEEVSLEDLVKLNNYTSQNQPKLGDVIKIKELR